MSIKILTPTNFDEYVLLDTGDRKKLERFGNNTIVRPFPEALWKPINPSLWQTADARCFNNFNKIEWQTIPTFRTPWRISFTNPFAKGLVKAPLVFELGYSISKNVGIFPEQAPHWSWIIECIKQAQRPVSVLNLFGYTGAATLAAAAAGAEVCHVDASKSAINRAKRNQELSNLNDAPIRWIVDDCLTFVEREKKRGRRYDALIMDPPPFGKDAEGKMHTFNKEIKPLLAACKAVLAPRPLFVIFNNYAMNQSPLDIGALMRPVWPKAVLEYGELAIQENHNDRCVAMSIFSRFSNV